MKTMKSQKRQQQFGNMPRLKHREPDQLFDPTKSEVLRWIANNPTALGLLFDQLHAAGAIVFDPETHEWRGCDTP